LRRIVRAEDALVKCRTTKDPRVLDASATALRLSSITRGHDSRQARLLCIN
jgi:hypothetical protein